MAGPVPGPLYPPPPSRSNGGGAGGVLTRILWSAVPVLTLGLFAFAPALFLAIRQRRSRDWAGFAFFFATVVLEWVAAANLPETPSAILTGQDLAFAAILLVNMVGAVVHVCLMYQSKGPAVAVARPAPAPYGYPQGFPPGPAAAPRYGHPPQAQAARYPAGPGVPQPPSAPQAAYAAQPHQPQPQVPQQPPQPPQSQAQPRPAPAAPAPAPPTRPNEADQVKAELEELSELLRRQD